MGRTYGMQGKLCRLIGKEGMLIARFILKDLLVPVTQRF